MMRLAHHPDRRKCLLLLEAMLETPGLVERLADVLRPELNATPRVVRKGTNEEAGR